MVAQSRMLIIAAFGMAGIVLTTGCQRSTKPVSEKSEAQVVRPPHSLPASEYRFASPVRLEAEGKFVSVESPGYACPTMADVDRDGIEDLVVGQFAQGRLQFFKNLAGPDEPPRLAAAEWIQSGGERAIVPGVW